MIIAPGDKISFTTAEDRCENAAKKHNNNNNNLYHQKYSSEEWRDEEPYDGFAPLGRHSPP